MQPTASPADHNPFLDEGPVVPNSPDEESAKLSFAQTATTSTEYGSAPADLNPDQYAAVYHRNSPALVVAGPGSGKTTVLTERIATLLSEGVPAQSILAVTFTNKAAGEMRERVSARVGHGAASGVWLRTFHSFCVKMLRTPAAAAAAGVSPNFEIADLKDLDRLLSETLTAHGVAEEASDVGPILSRAKNDLSQITGHTADHKAAAYIAKPFELACRQAGVLGFDDLLVFAHRALSVPDIARIWAERFTHVMVDEYQDTNRCQYEILRLLAGSSSNVFVVGDIDQSIYSWRGAQPEVVTQFTNDWPTATVITLGVNYRSTPNIIEAAKTVVAEVPSAIRPEFSTPNSAGEEVVVACETDERAEAQKIADHIKYGDYPHEECAVLVRTHAAGRSLEQALVAAQLPYVVAGGMRFSDRAEVRDTLSWLRLVVNPHNFMAMRRAASVPRRGLGPKGLEAVTALTDDTISCIDASLLLVEDDSTGARIRNPLISFLGDYNKIVEAATTSGPSAAVEEIVGMDGFLDAATVKSGTSKAKAAADAEERREYVNQLLSAAVEFESAVPSKGLDATTAFVEHLALLEAASSAAESVGAVTVSTVHAVKGREFDAVYIAGVEADMFPHFRSSTEAEIDEERRLLYVGMTRARFKLRLSWAQRRAVNGRWEDRLRSPFVDGFAPTVVPKQRHSSAHRASRGTPSSAGRPRSVMSSPPQPKAPRPNWRVENPRADMRVEHASFGKGTITAVDTASVKVAFDEGSARVLVTDKAPMRVI